MKPCLRHSKRELGPDRTACLMRRAPFPIAIRGPGERASMPANPCAGSLRLGEHSLRSAKLPAGET